MGIVLLLLGFCLQFTSVFCYFQSGNMFNLILNEYKIVPSVCESVTQDTTENE